MFFGEKDFAVAERVGEVTNLPTFAVSALLMGNGFEARFPKGSVLSVEDIRDGLTPEYEGRREGSELPDAPLVIDI